MHDAPPLAWNCVECGGNDAFYRCKSCFGQDMVWCLSCCLAYHQRAPFHYIQFWNGNFFEPKDLNDLGLILHSGHQGSPCPNHTTTDSPSIPHLTYGDPIQIVTSTGIFVRRISWCSCRTPLQQLPPKHIQLLRLKLFPATPLSPGTAFTFECLKDYYLQSVECKTSALKYITKIRRFSSPFDSETKNAQANLFLSHCSF